MEKSKNIDLLQKEASLRVSKMEECIKQQAELHEIRKAAAQQEKEYWKIKTELLQNSIPNN